MDEADAGALFEPFFTTKPAGKGTGPGLPRRRESCRRSRLPTSSPSSGGGAMIFTRLCAAIGRPSRSKLLDAERARWPGDDSCSWEDEPGVRQAIATVLRDAGYEVIGWCGPSEALRRSWHEPGNAHRARAERRGHAGDLAVRQLVADSAQAAAGLTRAVR